MLTFGSFSSRTRCASDSRCAPSPQIRIRMRGSRKSGAVSSKHIQALFHTEIPSVNGEKLFRREAMPASKFTACWRRRRVVQRNRVRKIDELRFGHSLDAKTLEHALGNAGDAGRMPIGERFERIQRPRKPTRFQHPEPDGGVRLHILDMKNKRRAFDFSDEPSRDAEQERRRNEHINIGARKRQSARKVEVKTKLAS